VNSQPDIAAAEFGFEPANHGSLCGNVAENKAGAHKLIN